MSQKFGSEKCCKGCSTDRQLACELCNQCDALDPFISKSEIQRKGRPTSAPAKTFTE